jgi:hypothetical protein
MGWCVKVFIITIRLSFMAVIFSGGFENVKDVIFAIYGRFIFEWL